ALLANRQKRLRSRRAFDVAADVAVEVQDAREFDIAVDPGHGADQGVDFGGIIPFRFEHLSHPWPRVCRPPPFPATFPGPSRRRPVENCVWDLCPWQRES